MRKLILSAAIIFFSIAAKAQDANYKGPARMLVMAFWNEAGKLQNNKGGSVINLESLLADTKSKDVAYNTSAMEDEIKKWKAKSAAQPVDPVKARNQLSADITRMFNDITNCIQITIPSKENDIADFKARVKYILERKEILAAFKEKYKDDAYLETLVDELKNGSEIPLNREINNVVLTINSPYGNASSEETDFKATYYKIQGLQAYWEAAQQMFPEIPECGEALKKCNELTTKYGTVEKIKAVSKANLVAEIKSRKLPAPVVKDAALEKILIEGFNKKYGPAYNAKAVKAVLTQDGWTIERNSISGIITGRNRTGKIAYKTEQGDGKCYLLSNNIFIYQAFVGNAFISSEVIYNGLGGDEMLCENVK
jgi:hypothetical protein